MLRAERRFDMISLVGLEWKKVFFLVIFIAGMFSPLIGDVN